MSGTIEAGDGALTGVPATVEITPGGNVATGRERTCRSGELRALCRTGLHVDAAEERATLTYTFASRLTAKLRVDVRDASGIQQSATVVLTVVTPAAPARSSPTPAPVEDPRSRCQARSPT